MCMSIMRRQMLCVFIRLAHSVFVYLRICKFVYIRICKYTRIFVLKYKVQHVYQWGGGGQMHCVFIRWAGFVFTTWGHWHPDLGGTYGTLSRNSRESGILVNSYDFVQHRQGSLRQGQGVAHLDERVRCQVCGGQGGPSCPSAIWRNAQNLNVSNFIQSAFLRLSSFQIARN